MNCLNCKKNTINPKFCSRSCASSFNNKGIRRHGRPKTVCLQCGKTNRTSKNKYCSNQCQRSYQWAKTVNDVQAAGIIEQPWTRRRFLIEKYGHKCTICKRSTWMGTKIPIVADHINGNPEDHRIENLRLICCNCDAQLPTYKARNRGNGRHSRRARYSQGKSY